MKVNFKRLVLWLIVVIIWSGSFTYLNYVAGQHYGSVVATEQFEDDTLAYRELKTQNAVQNGLSVIGIAGAIFCLGMVAKSFKITKEE